MKWEPESEVHEVSVCYLKLKPDELRLLRSLVKDAMAESCDRFGIAVAGSSDMTIKSALRIINRLHDIYIKIENEVVQLHE